MHWDALRPAFQLLEPTDQTIRRTAVLGGGRIGRKLPGARDGHLNQARCDRSQDHHQDPAHRARILIVAMASAEEHCEVSEVRDRGANRGRNGTRQNVTVFDVTELVREYAFHFAIVH
jgi:hypothetical protein